jgi:hypothetical protein
VDKIKINYFENKLNFENIPRDEYKHIRNLWSKVREDYTDWVANFRVENIETGKSVAESLKWRGMSTWWFNPLSEKNVENGRYFNQLMVLYMIKRFDDNIEIALDDKILSTTIMENFPHVSLSYKLAKLKQPLSYYNIKLYLTTIRGLPLQYVKLLKSIIQIVSISILVYKYKRKQIKRYKHIKSSIWFVSTYPANWITLNNKKQDRHFLKSIDLDCHYNESARYAIYLYNYSKDRKLGYFELCRQLDKLEEDLGKEVVFIESHISMSDIISSYYSTFCEWIKFRKWVKQDNFKDLFIMNGIDVSLILQDVWLMGYFGSIQYCKMHGLAMGRFLSKLDNPQTIVTYGDFFSEFRGDYFFGNFFSPDSKFVSVQHSQMSKNYGAAYNRKSEFDNNLDQEEGCIICPAPDYYCAQGDQYKNILNSFYPSDRIEVIGSLRHASIKAINKNKITIKENIILVAFSTTDVEILLSFLKSIRISSSWKIIITPHPTNDIVLLEELLEKNCSHLNFFFNSSESTISLLPHTKLFIGSMTNLVFESCIYNVRSVRIVPIDLYPVREGDSRIPEFHDGNEFSLWFENNKDKLMKESIEGNMNSIIKEYYYRIDGKSSERLWEFIMSQAEFPHNKFRDLLDVNDMYVA